MHLPEFEFTEGNAFDPTILQRVGKYQVFFFLEVLEHLEADLELLRCLPSGALMILSVPNYDSEGHVRTFESASSVIARYSTLISFHRSAIRVLPRKGKNRKTHKKKRIFLLHGEKH